MRGVVSVTLALLLEYGVFDYIVCFKTLKIISIVGSIRDYD